MSSCLFIQDQDQVTRQTWKLEHAVYRTDPSDAAAVNAATRACYVQRRAYQALLHEKRE